MTCHLLDVNLLVALHMPDSVAYQRCQRWFINTGSQRFATCSITQSGFLRVSSLPVLKGHPLDMRELRAALAYLTARPEHEFWPGEIPYLDATAALTSRVQGHKQITDAYLLGLAIHRKAKFATLDRGILHLAGSEFAEHVELIH